MVLRVFLHFRFSLIGFQDLLGWDCRSPMTFQRFTNSYFGTSSFPIKSKHIFEYFVRGINTHTNRIGLFRNALSKKQKHQATVSLYPIINNSSQCSMLLLINLAEPEWISVPCEESMLSDVFCMTNKNLTRHKFHTNQIFCDPSQLIVNKICLSFVWFTNSTH